MIKHLRTSLGCAFALIATLWLIQNHKLAGTYDPDRYYHFAISKIYAESGTPKTLPAVDGLGWQESFAEKEYLFHRITQIGYRLGGESGVLITASVITGLLFFGLFAFSFNLYPSFWTPALWAVSLLGASRFVSRMNFLRPHVLGILLLLALIAALIKKKPKFVFLITALFALAYHAIYLPFILITIYLIALKLNEDRFQKWPLIGVLGLTVGILLNPFFPDNLFMGIRHLWIALFEMRNLGLDFGNELIPLRSDQYFNEVLSLLMIVCLGFSIWFFKPKYKSTEYTFLLFCMTAFTLLGALSPRSLEIAFPIALLFTVVLFKEFKPKWLVIGLLVICGFTQRDSYKAVLFPQVIDESGLKAIIAGIQDLKIPSGSKVFNCEWDSTPYLMVANPGLKFIDLLDPSFLWVHNKSLAESRYQLRGGSVLDPYGYMKTSFNADYAYCKSEPVNQQLELDPRFKKIFPKPDSKFGGPHLYELASSETPQFIRSFSFAFLNTLESKDPNLDYLKLTPSSVKDFKPSNESAQYQKGLFFDFMPHFKSAFKDAPKEKLEKGAFCTVVKVDTSEIKKNVGANYLGVGGGRNIRVWFNGKQFYNSLVPSDQAKLFVNLVRFDQPLKTSDRIETVLCSSTQASYHALALSLWTQKELDQVCEFKGYKTPQHLKERGDWKYSGYSEVTCLGTVAQKSQN